MKTRILSFAAMLLMSVSMFAQSAVKGDVNNDGVVDVADVAAVIDIMKNGGGVAVLPTSVEMKETTMVAIGSEVTLKATVLPENATDKTITWTSSNTSVATVSDAGVVKGIAEGTATITATTANGKTATCEVTVHQTQYYWYVGKTDPSTMTSISPIVENDIADSNGKYSPGWRLIGTTLPTYNSSNMLWSGGSDGTDIAFGSRVTYYLALPSNTIKLYSVGTDLTSDTITLIGNIVIDGVTYYIYSSKSPNRYFRYDLY